MNRFKVLSITHRIASAALSTAALGLAGTPISAQAQADESAAVMQKLRGVFGNSMPRGATVSPSPVPGFYAMKVPGFKGCPMFMDSKVSVIANNGRKGWTYVAGGKPLSAEDQAAVMRSIYGALPPDLPRVGPTGAKADVVLVTGVDCAASKVVEDRLKAANASYRRLPTALDRANLHYAVSAVCSPKAVSASGAAKPAQAGAGADRCEVTETLLSDLGCMASASYPSALSANGVLAADGQAVLRMMAVR